MDVPSVWGLGSFSRALLHFIRLAETDIDFPKTPELKALSVTTI
jgi:hypothetical protein